MKKILPLIFFALLVFGAYAPALRDDFVWDDTALILRDPLIRSPRLIAEGFQHFLFTDATASDFYRPIQRLTYTLDYAAFALRPAAYHCASIAWHLAATIALFFFALEFFQVIGVDRRIARVVAIASTALWAIHPVHTSAVAYISGRADSLAAAFGFAALWLGLRSLRMSGARFWVGTIASAVLLLLSALSKELGLIFLALWLTILLAQKNWRAARAAIVAVIFVLAAYWSLRAPAEHILPPTHSPIPALVRPVLVARAFAEYAGLLVFPINLHMERDVETRPTGFTPQSATNSAWRELQTLAGILIFGAFVYWIFRERRRDRAVFLLLILTLVAYLPVSGMIGLNATVAEHWLYLPSAFLFLALGLWLARFLKTAPNFLRPLTISALTLWAIFLGGRTFARTLDWKDQRTFLERTIAQGGDSARMLINLASLEIKEDHPEKAKALLFAALKKEPDQPLAILDLAAIAVKEKDYSTAHQLLARAKDMPLVEAQAYELMTILESKERGKANLLRMRLASRSGPSNWAIEKRYVKLLDELGDREGAIRELQGCLVTQWYRADSWQLLGVLLARAGRGPEAAAAFARAHLYDVHLVPDPAS
ncbi:MAG: tetratricopeptide repeat protein [Chthoniobacterales bacterium]